MTNKEIAGVFKLTGKLMEVHDENSFKSKSYANASFQLSKHPQEIASMNEDEIANIPRVGSAIHKKILDLLHSGTFKLLDELLSKTPEGVIEMLNIKGLGGKKIRTIWLDLGCETIGELYYACLENRLASMKGFGEKTQQSVIESIEYYNNSRDKLLYAAVEEYALGLLTDLQFQISDLQMVGDVGRQNEIVESIEMVSSLSTSALEMRISLQAIEENENSITFATDAHLPLIIHSVPKDDALERIRLNSSPEHYQAIYQKAKGKTEEEIYSSLGMNFIPPPLREGMGELERAKHSDFTNLITLEDLKGIIHNHTTYSDGMHSLQVMAQYAAEMGMEYLCICDHSKTAVYAGGLTEEDIQKQHEEMDTLNSKMTPFKILKGIESDILGDGSLDYSDDILSTFDIVVASVHSNLKMEKDVAHKRLIKAIENPFTTILGHMTGRLLLSRPGYELDHEYIIDACAANNVVIELNANPHRLDMDWRFIGYAMEKGVMISINPDAHKKEGYHDMHYGVLAGRKGLLSKDMTYNALGLQQLEAKLNKALA